MIIINPGTETSDTATEENAQVVADTIYRDFKDKVAGLKMSRNKDADGDGWFGYILSDGKTDVTVDIPGDEPEQVLKGEPWKSRRLYVDGSSWLCGYAYGIIADRFGLE